MEGKTEGGIVESAIVVAVAVTLVAELAFAACVWIVGFLRSRRNRLSLIDA